MYCPRCNLHSEEYVDRCPLCDGPMEVDEVGGGFMKTPRLRNEGGTEELPPRDPLKLDGEHDYWDDTETVSLDQDHSVEAAVPADDPVVDDDFADPVFEKSQPIIGGEDIPPASSSHVPLKNKRSQSSTKGLVTGLLVILVLLLAGAGYYYFYVSQDNEPAKQTIAVVEDPHVSVSNPSTEFAPDSSEPQPEFSGSSEKTGEVNEKPEEISPQTENVALAVSEKPVVEDTRDAPEAATAGTQGAQKLPMPQVKADLSSPTPAEIALADAHRAIEAGKSLPVTSPEGSYVVHVGSFRSDANAERLKDKLVQKGYPASTTVVHLPETGDWYRVIVGSYAKKNEADVIADKLAQEEDVPARIMHR